MTFPTFTRRRRPNTDIRLNLCPVCQHDRAAHREGCPRGLMRRPLPRGSVTHEDLRTRPLLIDGLAVNYGGNFVEGWDGLFVVTYTRIEWRPELRQATIWRAYLRADGGLDLFTARQ